MLHILWKIVMLILIFLGIVLGLLLAAVFLLLFCPVRYSVSVQKKEAALSTTRIRISICWLFHAVRIDSLRENGSWKRTFRLFGISAERWKRKRKKKKQNRKNEQEKKEIISSIKEPVLESKSEEGKIPVKKTGKNGNSAPKKNIFTALLGKLKNTGKIRLFFQKIMQNIRELSMKAEWWKQFIQDAYVQETFFCVKKHLLILLKHLFPTTLKGSVQIGNEDPSVTGGILAVLGMTMPFHKNRIQIQPIFESENVLEGFIYAKGRGYGIVLLVVVLRVILNKKVKYTINYWKNKEDVSEWQTKTVLKKR